MKNIKNIYFTIVAALIISSASVSASVMKDLMNNFEENAGYVKPVATFTTTLQNMNLHTSARINKGFGFGFNIPIILAYADDGDFTYNKTFNTGCANVEAFHENERANGNITSYVPGSCPAEDTKTIKVPTMWGPKTNQRIYTYEPTMGGDGYSLRYTGNVSDGIEAMNDYFVPKNIPLLFPELSFSYYYTRLKIRYMGTFGAKVGAPAFKAKLNFITFGLQHDIRSFLKKEIPVDVSLSFNLSFWGLKAAVNETDVQGDLALKGISTYTAVLVGKNVTKWFRPYLEMGVETSRMKTGGEMIETLDDGTTEDIKPNLNVKGRNGFKLALGVTLQPGTWLFGLNQSFGPQRATAVNFLNYNKDGKDE